MSLSPTDSNRPDPPNSRVLGALAFLLVSWTLYLSLYPFDWVRGSDGFVRGLSEGARAFHVDDSLAHFVALGALGGLEGFALYERALDPTTVRELSTLPFDDESATRRRIGAGAVAVYSCREGEPVLRGIGAAAPPLAVVPASEPDPDSNRPAEVLRLTEWRYVVAEAGSAELCARLAGRAEFAVEVRCASESVDQIGPARIISLSADTFERNFTFSQSEDRLVLRVRTPLNGVNGTGVEGAWTDVFVDDEMHHLVASYERGRLTFARDGRLSARAVDLALPRPDWTWNPMDVPLLPAFLLFLPIGMMASIAWSTTGRRKRLLLEILIAGGLAAGGAAIGPVRFDAGLDGTVVLVAAVFVPLGDRFVRLRA